MKMLAISCASSTRPPPLPRRSSTIPRAPSLSACWTACITSTWAPGVNEASATTPSFLPWKVSVADATTGSDTIARVILTVRSGDGCARAAVGTFDLEHHVGARRALDQGHRLVAGEPLQRAPVDGHDHLPALQAGAGRGGVVEHTRDLQAAVHGADFDPDPGEVRRQIEFPQFARA